MPGSHIPSPRILTAKVIITMLVGLLLVLLGVIFALQGEGVLGGSSFMDNNSAFVYIGSSLALVGAVLAVLGFWSRRRDARARPV